MRVVCKDICNIGFQYRCVQTLKAIGLCRATVERLVTDCKNAVREDDFSRQCGGAERLILYPHDAVRNLVCGSGFFGRIALKLCFSVGKNREEYAVRDGVNGILTRKRQLFYFGADKQSFADCTDFGCQRGREGEGSFQSRVQESVVAVGSDTVCIVHCPQSGIGERFRTDERARGQISRGQRGAGESTSSDGFNM